MQEHAWVADAEKVLGISLSTDNRNGDRAADGPCPKCGGTDRFLVYNESGYAKCTHCPYKTWWKKNGSRGSVQDVIQTFKEERAELKVKMLDVDWKVYHRVLMDNRNLWSECQKRKFTEMSMINFGLGYAYGGPTGSMNPTLTIPVFMDGVLVDIRHKFLTPPKPGYKYRSHFSGVLPFPYNYDSISEHTPTVIVLEGELKVISFVQDGWSSSIGISGKNMVRSFLPQIEDKVSEDQKWIIAFDTEVDAETQALQLANGLSAMGVKDIRLAFFPLKPDDFLLKYGKENTETVLAQAIRYRNK